MEVESEINQIEELFETCIQSTMLSLSWVVDSVKKEEYGFENKLDYLHGMLLTLIGTSMNTGLTEALQRDLTIIEVMKVGEIGKRRSKELRERIKNMLEQPSNRSDSQ